MGLTSSLVRGTLHPLGWQERKVDIWRHLEQDWQWKCPQGEPGMLQRGLRALGDGVPLSPSAWLWSGLRPPVKNGA